MSQTLRRENWYKSVWEEGRPWMKAMQEMGEKTQASLESGTLHLY